MPSSDHVLIVMGLYNGAAFVRDQLQSFAGQTHENWSLIASDDGSTDDSVQILTDFAADHLAQVVPGPQINVAMNFLSLLAGIPGDPAYVALSDQDDVWLPDHLSRAIEALEAVPADQPGLYGSATWIVDEDLGNRRPSPEFPLAPSFRNALVQSIAGGNTMVLNRAGWQLARAAAVEAIAAGGPAMQDWWLYQLVSGAGGRILRDNRPSLLYRQHGRNVFGSNRGWRATWYRVVQVWRGDLAAWIDTNIRALQASSDRLTPDNLELLTRFTDLRQDRLWARLRGFGELRLHRQGRASQLVLWLAVALKKL